MVWFCFGKENNSSRRVILKIELELNILNSILSRSAVTPGFPQFAPFSHFSPDLPTHIISATTPYSSTLAGSLEPGSSTPQATNFYFSGGLMMSTQLQSKRGRGHPSVCL